MTKRSSCKSRSIGRGRRTSRTVTCRNALCNPLQHPRRPPGSITALGSSDRHSPRRPTAPGAPPRGKERESLFWSWQSVMESWSSGWRFYQIQAATPKSPWCWIGIGIRIFCKHYHMLINILLCAEQMCFQAELDVKLNHNQNLLFWQ